MLSGKALEVYIEDPASLVSKYLVTVLNLSISVSSTVRLCAHVLYLATAAKWAIILQWHFRLCKQEALRRTSRHYGTTMKIACACVRVTKHFYVGQTMANSLSTSRRAPLPWTGWTWPSGWTLTFWRIPALCQTTHYWGLPRCRKGFWSGLTSRLDSSITTLLNIRLLSTPHLDSSTSSFMTGYPQSETCNCSLGVVNGIMSKKK